MDRLSFDFEKPIVELEKKIKELRAISDTDGVDISDELSKMEDKAAKMHDDIYSKLTRWQRVQIARHPKRPYTLDYIQRICDTFQEVHGDRNFKDDPALVTGFGSIDGNRIAIIGHQKGRGTKENIHRNFGMPNPEGYRKALRVMKLAEKFNLPILTFIDTQGAYPGLGAEERGQAEAIARNLFEMSALRVPVISVVIGEGGSGGALAIGIADRLLILEYAYYSVITPEGCASILYRDAAQADKAAEAMKITAQDMDELNLVDELIAEPSRGAHHDWDATAANLKDAVNRHFAELAVKTGDELVNERIDKYGRIGFFSE